MIGIALALLAAAPAAAAPSPAPATAQPDAATLAAARELIRASDIQSQLRALGPAMAQAAEQQMRGMFTNAAMPEGLQTKVTAVMQDYLSTLDAAFTPEVQDEMATIYARHFTAEELRHVTEMLSDPVMVHFRQETPQLMGELMPAMMRAMQPRQQAFQAKLMGVIRDWIRSHPEDRSKLRQPISAS